MKKLVAGALMLLLTSCVATTRADDPQKPAEYGTLKGRFVWDGEVPAAKEIRVIGHEEELARGGHLPLLDEQLIVDPKTKGIANVCVWLYLRRGETIKPHPLYDAPLMDGEPGTTINMHGTRYVPRIAVTRTKRPGRMTTSDDLLYNPKLQTLVNPDPFGGVAPVGGVMRFELKKPEIVPVRIDDMIYPWMTGWLIVQEHPYVAVTDTEGRFKIQHVPIGPREFVVWHEKYGYVKKATRGGAEQSWPRGRLQIDLTPAGVDLGDVLITPKEEE